MVDDDDDDLWWLMMMPGDLGSQKPGAGSYLGGWVGPFGLDLSQEALDVRRVRPKTGPKKLNNLPGIQFFGGGCLMGGLGSWKRLLAGWQLLCWTLLPTAEGYVVFPPIRGHPGLQLEPLSRALGWLWILPSTWICIHGLCGVAFYSGLKFEALWVALHWVWTYKKPTPKPPAFGKSGAAKKYQYDEDGRVDIASGRHKRSEIFVLCFECGQNSIRPQTRERLIDEWRKRQRLIVWLGPGGARLIPVLLQIAP